MKQSFNDQQDSHCNTKIETDSIKGNLKRQDKLWAFDDIVTLLT